MLECWSVGEVEQILPSKAGQAGLLTSRSAAPALPGYGKGERLLPFDPDADPDPDPDYKHISIIYHLSSLLSKTAVRKNNRPVVMGSPRR